MKKRDSKISPKKLPDWERLLSAQVIFQAQFPESVLVGGTAASLHAKHRVSTDADYVLSDLKKKFSEILRKVEHEAGWVTKRVEPPVLILGHFQGMRTGIRQLIRSQPLETTIVQGLRIPTIGETLRIKAYLIVCRNTTRDFIDFVALFDHLGTKNSLEALENLDDYYPQEGGNSVSQQLTLQLAEPKPWDLTDTDLSHYKELKAPYTDWAEVKRRAAAFAQKILQEHLASFIFPETPKNP